MKHLILLATFLLLSSQSSFSQCNPGDPDHDNDGICNAADLCPNMDDALIGTPCDDNNACTENDIWTSNCDCEGTFLSDADNDRICDDLDVCPNFDDDIDIDNDGIPYCLDDCVDVNENDICDQLENEPVTDDLKVYFSYKRGFYENDFQLTLISKDPNATIRYTNDSEWPSPTNGEIYTQPINITTTTIIKAITYNALDTSKVYTHSYIFLQDVVNQPAGLSIYPADTQMDPDVVNDPLYSEEIFEGFSDIMSLSITLPEADFISNDRGIYKNPFDRGIEWEREASLEFLFTNGDHFQENMGVRIHGGASRGRDKKAFRIYFREEYGPKKLEYPLFGKEASDEIDAIVLRCRGGQSWVHSNATHRSRAQMYRDQIARELQGEMGHLHVHGTQAHLYINGVYWGEYNVIEFLNQAYFADYLGGEKEDYEIWNHSGQEEGANDTWTDLHNYIAGGINTEAQYNYVKSIVDLENLADYILLNFFGGNNDWDHNNWYAAKGINGKWQFYAWDNEQFFKELSLDVSAKNNAEKPTRIFTRLMAYPDFKQLFMDRVHCHMANNGVLTQAALDELWMKGFARLGKSIIPESARWGDNKRANQPYTLYNEFLTEQARLRDTYFHQRQDVVYQQLMTRGFYTDAAAPVVYSSLGGEVAANLNLTLTNPNPDGTLYYTIDGTDPRLPGGDVSPAALVYDGAIQLSTITEVRARVKIGNHWSPNCPQLYFPMQNYGDLVINEIHYQIADSIFFNPEINAQDTVDGKNFEFVELKNTGTDPINLYQSEFTKGINLKIDSFLIIPPGGFAVFAEDAYWFENRYGFPPDGVYEGQLDNEGEKINLKDPQGYFIDTVRYSHLNPWDEAPAGQGYSLELLNSDFNNNDPLNWFRSDQKNGTPKAENSRVCNNSSFPIVINEINYNSDNDNFDAGDWVELYNQENSMIDLSNWTFYDNGNKFTIPTGTNIEANGYLILIEDSISFKDAFPDVPANLIIGNLPFSLSNKGERISLFESSKCLVDYVIYSDKNPWPETPDGDGATLSLIDPVIDNALSSSWEASDTLNPFAIHGSPGMSNLCPGINTYPLLCNQIIAGNDDAEENVADGTVTISSKDLDLGDDEGVIFQVGMRFQNINIPQGATITSATIQFAADEINTVETAITFWGENIADAPAFEATLNNISTRNKTSNNVIWQPTPWNKIGENNTPQKTIDLSPIIQEIISRSDFTQGNALAILAEATGIRTAESFNGSPNLAPKLCISYTTGTCVVNAKIWLEGFYDETNNNMHTKLKNNNLLPLTQPFNTAPWNYEGTENVTTLPENTVDWILVMRRNSMGDILEQAAGFVNQLGQLMNLDGSLGIPLSIQPGDYISIHHRSHLDIISSTPYDGEFYNFTTSVNQAQGGEQLKLIDGKYMLYAGDFDGKGIINSDDFNNWKVQSAAINQYIPIDGDGNGIVNVMDFNLWIINRSKVGHPSIRY